MTLLGSANGEVILLALDRWKDLWDLVSRNDEGRFKSYEGFERHAGDYWWLTRTIWKVVQSRDQSCRYMQPVPSDSAKDLHDFVRKYKEYVC
ncbi:hypothetical protein HJFPF1_07197 [Paramyrothecium foliicola]|nr:hypothetical protein HJFPF1_07197 [Paramyrothecium foliicola]